MLADDYARRFYPPRPGEDLAARWVAWNLRNYRRHGFGLWVVEAVAGGEFLGDCGLTLQRVESEEMMELGYHLVAGHRGNGYATEAGAACLSFAFSVLEAPVVCSIVAAGNPASIAVAGRLHRHERELDDEGGPRLLFWTERTEYEAGG
jgi:RimJ/RimL family protein N-acetyltransferase